jgi:hypothetical protein
VGRDVSRSWRDAVDQALNSPPIQGFFSPEDSSVWHKLSESGESAFAVLLTPGNTRAADTRSPEIVDELRRRSLGRIPLFGGCAADDWRMECNYVFCGRQAFPDSMLVAVFETGLQFGIAMAHGFQPAPLSATVTRSQDHEVLELDGRPAAEAYAKLFGLSRESLEGQHLTLTTNQPLGIADAYGQYSINVATYFTRNDGIRFAQSIAEGSQLTVMEPAPDGMGAGRKALLKAMLRAGIADPAVALVCSCALRAKSIKERTSEEISGILEAIPNVPVVGFYGFGEQGVTDDGSIRHNNEVITVLILGRELTCAARLARNNDLLQAGLVSCAAEQVHVDKVRREANDRFRAMFAGARDAIIVFDMESSFIVDANASAVEMTKRSKHELTSLRYEDIIPFDQMDDIHLDIWEQSDPPKPL